MSTYAIRNTQYAVRFSVQGLSMTSTSRSPAPYDPADIASVMRLLAEAPDRRSFLATLHEALPRLLPATRVDILANEAYDGDYLLLSSGAEGGALSPAGKRIAANFA